MEIAFATTLTQPILTDSTRIALGVLSARLLLDTLTGPFITEEVTGALTVRARVNADCVFTDAVTKTLIRANAGRIFNALKGIEVADGRTARREAFIIVKTPEGGLTPTRTNIANLVGRT